MNKVEKDGKVAVLYTSVKGAGWSSWNEKYKEILTMDADIVNAVLSNNLRDAEQIALAKCPDMFSDGYRGLKVEWVDKGCEFEIKEFRGREIVNVIGYFSNLIA